MLIYWLLIKRNYSLTQQKLRKNFEYTWNFFFFNWFEKLPWLAVSYQSNFHNNQELFTLPHCQKSSNKRPCFLCLYKKYSNDDLSNGKHWFINKLKSKDIENISHQVDFKFKWFAMQYWVTIMQMNQHDRERWNCYKPRLTSMAFSTILNLQKKIEAQKPGLDFSFKST